MNKKEYFERLGKVIVNKDVKVLFTHQIAACDVSKNQIVIPNLESIKCVSNPISKFWSQRMAFYHECGHILFTPTKKYATKDELHKEVLNFFEDLRVEHKLSELFPALKNKFALQNKLSLKNIDFSRLQLHTKKLVKAACAFYGLDALDSLDDVEKTILDSMKELEGKPTAKNCREISDKVYELLKNSENSENNENDENGENRENQENGENHDKNGENGENIENKNENNKINDKGSDSENIDSDVESELEREIQELEREIQELDIDIGKSESEVVFPGEEKERLIKESIVNRIVKILAQAKGSRKSYGIELRDAGENINIDALIQAKYDQNHIDFYDDYKRDRVDIKIILALDVSGSMHGDPLKIAKRALANFSEACERVGVKTYIIAFASYPYDLKTFDEKTSSSKIDMCNAGGGTHIDRVINRMEEIAKQNSKCCLGIVISDLGDYLDPVNRAIARAKKHLKLWAIKIECIDSFNSYSEDQSWERVFKIKDISELSYALEKLANLFIRSI
jgi:Mg-chelatase subunit ChlD